MDGIIERTAPRALPDWVERRGFTVDEYHRLAESGFLEPDARYELIEGEIVRMNAIGGPHIGAVMAITELMAALCRGHLRVSVQSSVRLGDRSEPEPDIALLRPRADKYRGRLPPLASDVALLIEVADSSLRLDKEVKLPLYARHNIPEVWIVDVASNVIEVHRAPADGAYAEVIRAAADGELAPLCLPGVRIAVADVLFN